MKFDRIEKSNRKLVNPTVAFRIRVCGADGRDGIIRMSFMEWNGESKDATW